MPSLLVVSSKNAHWRKVGAWSNIVHLMGGSEMPGCETGVSIHVRELGRYTSSTEAGGYCEFIEVMFLDGLSDT